MGAYSGFDGIQFCGSLFVTIYSFFFKKYDIGIPSLIYFIIYPLINEMIINTWAQMSNTMHRYKPSFKSRLVYSPKYNMSFGGLEKLHPFDSQKYKNVVDKLVDQYKIISYNLLEKPNLIERSILLEKVSKLYLIKQCYSIFLSTYIEMPFWVIPNFLLRWKVLQPMLYATEGTLIACEIANRMKWSVNLSGGYHHASTSSGGGFCVLPDITLAVHYIQTRMDKKKIMIIDLDAHQGNGYERDFLKDDNVFIVDSYNPKIYPKDEVAKKAIKLYLPVANYTNDEDYLTSLKRIQEAVNTFKPEFIIYNAGTDILQGDSLGNLTLTKDCVVQRDQYIINLALKNKVPVAMLLSGGYQKNNAEVIAASINNLYTKFNQIY